MSSDLPIGAYHGGRVIPGEVIYLKDLGTFSPRPDRNAIRRLVEEGQVVARYGNLVITRDDLIIAFGPDDWENISLRELLSYIPEEDSTIFYASLYCVRAFILDQIKERQTKGLVPVTETIVIDHKDLIQTREMSVQTDDFSPERVDRELCQGRIDPHDRKDMAQMIQQAEKEYSALEARWTDLVSYTIELRIHVAKLSQEILSVKEELDHTDIAANPDKHSELFSKWTQLNRERGIIESRVHELGQEKLRLKAELKEQKQAIDEGKELLQLLGGDPGDPLAYMTHKQTHLETQICQLREREQALLQTINELRRASSSIFSEESLSDAPIEFAPKDFDFFMAPSEPLSEHLKPQVKDSDQEELERELFLSHETNVELESALEETRAQLDQAQQEITRLQQKASQLKKTEADFSFFMEEEETLDRHLSEQEPLTRAQETSAMQEEDALAMDIRSQEERVKAQKEIQKLQNQLKLNQQKVQKYQAILEQQHQVSTQKARAMEAMIQRIVKIGRDHTEMRSAAYLKKQKQLRHIAQYAMLSYGMQMHKKTQQVMRSALQAVIRRNPLRVTTYLRLRSILQWVKPH